MSRDAKAARRGPSSGVGLGRFLIWEWDAIAGIVAAIAALTLHFLHIVQTEVLLTITVVLMALLFLRDLRRQHADMETMRLARQTEGLVERLMATATPPDAILVGPQQIQSASTHFSERARGEMIWFNVCLLMFRPQPLFDVLLRPALENPHVTGVQFLLDESERERWGQDVVPKARACRGFEKLREPHWSRLQESVSFISAERETSGQTEALLSFWGEPFMAKTASREVPRYIFHVQGHSELVVRLVELAREYRFRT